MTSKIRFSLSALALLAVAACSTVQAPNTQLTQARADFQTAERDPRAQTMASSEMRQAQDALSTAQASWQRRDAPEDVNHLAYVAGQRVAIAREAMNQRSAEAASGSVGARRDAIRLEARTQEVRTAQQQTERSQAQTDMMRAENRALQERLRDLKARPGPRGMVLTLEDVLFNSDEAQLRPAGLKLVDQLAVVLREYPHRTVTIEGYTDSTGSEAHNLALAGQRAAMVGEVLHAAGIASERMSMRGLGEGSPAASNQSAEGRAMNRRVEIVLSEAMGPMRGR